MTLNSFISICFIIKLIFTLLLYVYCCQGSLLLSHWRVKFALSNKHLKCSWLQNKNSCIFYACINCKCFHFLDEVVLISYLVTSVTLLSTQKIQCVRLKNILMKLKVTSRKNRPFSVSLTCRNLINLELKSAQYQSRQIQFAWSLSVCPPYSTFKKN